VQLKTVKDASKISIGGWFAVICIRLHFVVWLNLLQKLVSNDTL